MIVSLKAQYNGRTSDIVRDDQRKISDNFLKLADIFSGSMSFNFQSNYYEKKRMCGMLMWVFSICEVISKSNEINKNILSLVSIMTYGKSSIKRPPSFKCPL